MRLLLDTHVVLSLVQGDIAQRFPAIASSLSVKTALNFASVASLWEIAIKTRLGKLASRIPLDVIPTYLQALGLEILPINIAQVMTVADPEPQTRDPFNRLLIAQCQVEGMKLVTVDRAVVGHPMAFRQ